jgi:hypothetical protein
VATKIPVRRSRVANDPVPSIVRDWAASELDGVSGEIRVVRRGPWLLAYEGWGGFCVESVWDEKRSDEENEDAAYAYAEEQSPTVIREWVDKLSKCELVESGYMPTGLYGVTWALFRRKSWFTTKTTKDTKNSRLRTGASTIPALRTGNLDSPQRPQSAQGIAGQDHPCKSGILVHDCRDDRVTAN